MRKESLERLRLNKRYRLHKIGQHVEGKNIWRIDYKQLLTGQIHEVCYLQNSLGQRTGTKIFILRKRPVVKQISCDVSMF